MLPICFIQNSKLAITKSTREIDFVENLNSSTNQNSSCPLQTYQNQVLTCLSTIGILGRRCVKCKLDFSWILGKCGITWKFGRILAHVLLRMLESCTRQKFTAMSSSFTLNLKAVENSNLSTAEVLGQFCSFSIHLPVGFRVALQVKVSSYQEQVSCSHHFKNKNQNLFFFFLDYCCPSYQNHSQIPAQPVCMFK